MNFDGYCVEGYIYSNEAKKQVLIEEYFNNCKDKELWFKNIESEILSEFYKNKVKLI